MQTNTMPKILIVIVLYNTELKDSTTYNSLKKSLKFCSLTWELLIFNNSKEYKIISDIASEIVNSEQNCMLAGAYNYALEFAKSKNIEWLLLLDQDSEITDEYFIKLSETLSNKQITENTVSIIPFLIENVRIISPHKNIFFQLIRSPINYTGLLKGHITALNSLTLLRVEFISQIGGFSYKFPLDMLDYWIYYQIYKKNKLVYLLDLKVQHHLSVNNFEKNMTVERYQQIIFSEKQFIKEFGILEQFAYKCKLFFRTLKQFLFLRDKRYSKITFRSIF